MWEHLQSTTMILTQIIITFFSTIFILLCGQTIKAHWKVLNREQKESTVKIVQGNFKVVRRSNLVLGKVKGISKLHKYVNDGSKKD